jgi:hypothetical protein
VLAAASWGVIPAAGKQAAWRAVKPAPMPAAAAAAAFPAPPEEPVAPRIVMPIPPPNPVPVGGVRALTAADRGARGVGPLARRLRVLTPEEQRTRRLRLGNDPALVVSCWSDAASARALPDDVSAAATA